MILLLVTQCLVMNPNQKKKKEKEKKKEKKDHTELMNDELPIDKF